MLTAEELEERCVAVRAKDLKVDDELVRLVEAEVEEYSARYAAEPLQLPVPDVAAVLPNMGWLIYEASWDRVQSIDGQFDSLESPARERSQTAATLVVRIADAARRLPWREFAPRALGAIRAQALMESKRDTEAGFGRAWDYHDEVKRLDVSFRDSYGQRVEVDGKRLPDPSNPFILALDETFIQLSLAETGTACRTAERIMGEWAEDVDRAATEGVVLNDRRWARRLFGDLLRGMESGETSIATFRAVRDSHGLVDSPTSDRMALTTWGSNPGIMTARAALLLASFCPEMQRAGREPIAGTGSWRESQALLLRQFERAYRAIEEPVIAGDGTRRELRDEFKRAIVQLRLHLGLIAPGYDLPATYVFADCVAANPLDAEAIELLSHWLDEVVDGRQRGNANLVGMATMPVFITSVEQSRCWYGIPSGYREWRERWFSLDRYPDRPGRRERLARLMREIFPTQCE